MHDLRFSRISQLYDEEAWGLVFHAGFSVNFRMNSRMNFLEFSRKVLLFCVGVLRVVHLWERAYLGWISVAILRHFSLRGDACELRVCRAAYVQDKRVNIPQKSGQEEVRPLCAEVQ